MNPPHSLLDVILISPDAVLYEGKAHSVILPGEKGCFEVLPNHKPLMSRLFPGEITVDQEVLRVRRGIVKVGFNQVLALVEA